MQISASFFAPARYERPANSSAATPADGQNLPVSSTGDRTAMASPSAVTSSGYFAVDSLAGLLSAQGQAVVAPNLALSLHVPDSPTGPSSVSCSASGSGQTDAPLTASDIAERIIDDLGSDGGISLSEVERALDAPNPGKTTNSDKVIAADFAKLDSSGTDRLTRSQLTAAIQSYLDVGRTTGWQQRSSSTIWQSV